jgi:hypothetical protein
MGTLTACLRKAGKNINAEDKQAIIAAAAAYREQGLSNQEAAERAVQDRIAHIDALLAAPKAEAVAPAPFLPDPPTLDYRLKERGGQLYLIPPVGNAFDKPTRDALREWLRGAGYFVQATGDNEIAVSATSNSPPLDHIEDGVREQRIAREADKEAAAAPAPAPAPERTKAQIRAAEREAERDLYRDLVAAEMAEDGVSDLAAAIRARLGEVKLSDAQVDKLARAIHKQRAKAAAEREKSKHRDPAVLAAAVHDALPPGPNLPAHVAAFTGGFHHAVAGRVISALVGEHLALQQRGFKAGQAWVNDTEAGKAYFEGRAVNKLENTGADLKRYWDKLKAEMKANESDVKKAWRQIERATNRADLFAPLMPKEATPGFKLYVTRARDMTMTFKEWLEERFNWHGAEHYRSRYSDSKSNIEYILDGQRRPADAERDRWSDDEGYRADWLRDAATQYIAAVREFAGFLEGKSSVLEAAEAFDDRYVDKAKAGTAGQKNSYYYAAENLSEAGKLLYARWIKKDGKSTANTAQIVSVSRGESKAAYELVHLSKAMALDWFNVLASNEKTVELPKKSDPLTHPKLAHITREGPKIREGNVTPAQFKQTFGFADVGFGNWVGAKEDQDHLNYSFDAFHDMAARWGVPTQMVGFGGKLHFTIGALGHGRKAAATYHPGHPHPDGGTAKVINVTKTKGDGTVGHEWGHALDDMLGGEWKNRVRRAVVELLQKKIETPESIEKIADRFLFSGVGWTGRSNKGNTPVQNAVMAMSYYSRDRKPESAYKINSDKLDKNYWGTEHEMFARAVEAWLVDTLPGKNNYLVNPAWAGDGAVTPAKGHRGTPYPTGEERKRIVSVIEALAKSIKWVDGQATVQYADFERNLPEDVTAGERRRRELMNEEAMAAYRDEKIAQREAEAQEKQAEQSARERAEREEADRLAAQKLAELQATIDPPTPAETQGPLTEEDYEAIFDQAAAELREESQEQPDVAPPPTADDPPPTREDEPQVDGKPNKADARLLADKVRAGQKIVFSGAKWAELSGLPTIHSFPSDKVRHIGFGMFEVKAPGLEGTWDAGGAMQRTESGVAYTQFAGTWDAYPAEKVLLVLDDIAGPARESAAPSAAPAPANDQSASALLAEAAKLGIKGADEALKGLAKLFGGGPGKLSSFPGGVDEETYQEAKVHFRTALNAAIASGKTLRELYKLLIRQLGDGIRPYLVRFSKEEGLTNNLGTAPAEGAARSPSMALAHWVRQRLSGAEPINWRDLFQAADDSFGGTQAEGKYSPKDAYDALEAAINLYVMDNADAFDPRKGREDALLAISRLERLLQMVPTQTKRTAEQDAMQQFSTVPTLGFVANWAANLRAGDVVMEPSAGIGGLAAFAKNAGAELVLNELSSRRAALLQEVFPASKVFTENAEQINNILPDAVVPSVVVMNPPFSNSAGGVKGDTMIGARHVEQALARLADGGRLVAIVGEGMARGRPAFRDWWKKIDGKYNVRAAVLLDGKGYAKYGTTFDNVLLVIDKEKPSGAEPIVGKLEKYEDLIPLLQGVRDDRPTAQRPADEREVIERDGAESAHDAAVSREEGGAGAGPAAGGGAVVGQGPSAGGGSGVAGAGGRGGRGGGTAGRPGAVPESGRGAGADAGNNAGGGGARDAAPAGRPESSGLTVNAQDAQRPAGELSESTFEGYMPQRLQVEGARPHPGKLVESAAMATVLPPKPTYTPNLPVTTITGFPLDPKQPKMLDGGVSIAQIEPVVYAGQAHAELLPTAGESEKPARKGYFIGDGTGVGKGREIGAIILDNIRQGRKRHVWVSEKQGLMRDAKRDFKGVGGDEALIFNQNKHPTTIKDKEGNVTGLGDIPADKDGIIFTTYATLRQGSQAQHVDGPPDLTPAKLRKEYPKGTTLTLKGSSREWEVVSWPNKGDLIEVKQAGYMYGPSRKWKYDQIESIDGVTEWRKGRNPTAEPAGMPGEARLDQLVRWLGDDFDGVIAFDEAHNAANAEPVKGERGPKDASAQALAVVELQKRLPNARVVYVSATGATQVANLAYARRLGLWGAGTPFATVTNFIAEIASAGLAAMELVARDLKQLGVYLARSLSYDGVTYSRIEHELTPLQRDMYNRVAEAWQKVLQNMNEALATTGAEKDGKAKGAMRSAFWGAQQRFFNQIITSMKMPTVLEQIERDLEAGDAVVLQLVNTNEAQQERALARRRADEDDDEDLEDLDMSPFDQLIEMVQKAYPVRQYEEYVDEEGKTKVRPVMDAGGNPVLNREAVAARDKLIKDLEAIRKNVPAGPLDILINHFGPQVVAEVTGRKQRVVDGRWNPEREVGSDGKTFIQARGKPAAQADADAFMADKKRMLVFSDAGGTGFSFHADLTKKNQRKRKHYLIQPGWRADKAVQGFGRSHRTNQASEPHYYLPSSDIPAEKRFLSAIARRLDQLGALTKGQRDTANQGLFSEKDNLEGPYAQQAVRQFFEDAQRGILNDASNQPISLQELLGQMGLEDIINPLTGQIAEAKMPETRLFLNRMLSLTLDMQDRVFGAFISIMEEKVEVAIQRGELDTGMQTIKALSATVKNDQVVWTDPRSGAETRYVQLELTQPTKIFSFPTEENERRKVEYFVNAASKRVWARIPSGQATLKTGAVVPRYAMRGTGGTRFLNEPDFKAGWNKVTREEAEKLWAAENAAKPATYTTEAHMIVGAMLPIWDRLKTDSRIKVARTQTSDGQRLLGRLIDAKDVKDVMKRLNVTSAAAKMGPAEIMVEVLKGKVAELTNGWRLQRAKVSDDLRIEVKGITYAAQTKELEAMGAISERIEWQQRTFIPTGPEGVKVLEKLFQSKPVADLIDPQAAKKAEPGDEPAMRQGEPDAPVSQFPASGARVQQLQAVVDEVTAQWERKLPVTVVASIEQQDVPQAVRDENARRIAAGKGPAKAVIAPNPKTGMLEAWIFADRNQSAASVVTGLYHEVLGHFGLRGRFGPELDKHLRRIAQLNQKQVRAMMERTGLKDEQRAAEEVLAYMAQTKPGLGMVQQAIAAIRSWLRKTFPGIFGRMELSDAELIRDFILPARRFVQGDDGPRGGQDVPGETAFSAGAAPFFSALQRGIEGVSAKALPVEGWRGAINQLVNKGAAKADEVEWSGLKEWLEMQQGKVTKEQVLDFLRANGVQVQEVTKGGAGAPDPVEQMESRIDNLIVQLDARGYIINRARLLDEARIDATQRGTGDLVANDAARGTGWIVVGYDEGDERPMAGEDASLFEQLDRAAEEYAEGAEGPGHWGEGGTRYSDWTLPGGERYREVLLTLPPTVTPEAGWSVKQMADGQWGVYAPTGYRLDDAYATKEQAESAVPKSMSRGYHSSHWSEPNILAHIRLNDRTDAEGKRVLFVEEIQSDWAQAGRKAGFMPKDPANPTDDEVRAYFDLKPEANPADYRQEMLEHFAGRYGYGAARDLPVPRAPFVESTNAWVTLALKRIVTMAAQEGYDRVAFVNGEQSAERYQLSKHVESIGWGEGQRRFPGGRSISIGTQRGQEIVVVTDADGKMVDAPSELQGKPLSEAVGEELAARIMAEPKGYLYGLDLRLGGKGMIDFYDKIVPAAANKLLEKIGGGKMRTISLSHGNQRGHFETAGEEDENGLPADDTPPRFVPGADVQLTQPGFDVTDAMREKAQAGLPLFAQEERRKAPRQVQVDGQWRPDSNSTGRPIASMDRGMQPIINFWRFYRDGKIVDSLGRPVLVYHGSPVRGFTEFDLSKVNANDPDAPYNGFWFSTSRDDAERSGRFPWGRPNADDAETREFYIALQNPATRAEARKVAREIEGNWEKRHPDARSLQDATRMELQARGFDGVIHEPYIADIEAAREEFERVGKLKLHRGEWIEKDEQGVALHSTRAGHITGYESFDDAMRFLRHGTFVVFDPKLIKASDNTQFDGANPDIRFAQGDAAPLGPNDPRQFRDLVREALGELGNTPGKLHWWDKTIGTPFHLAKRNPLFARVFWRVQDFLSDVSLFATEAADRAPSILPKLETWRDMLKTPPSAADTRAVAEPLFQGTLGWMRDKWGNPVNIEQIRERAETMNADDKADYMVNNNLISERVINMWRGLPIDQFTQNVDTAYERAAFHAGIVWTDDELRRMFNLTDKQIGLYREARAAVDRSITDLSVSDMLRAAGKDGAPVADAVRGMDPEAAAGLIRAQLEMVAQEHPARAQELDELAGKIEEKALKAVNLMAEGYFPLSRFGQYTVDVVDEDGNRLFFSLYESRFEAARAARELEAEFPGATVRRGTISQEEYKLFAGVSPETLELFGEMLGLESTGDEAMDKAFQAYLQLAKANRSAMKRLIHRKGVPGFSKDVGRVLAGFVYSNARLTSRNYHAGEIDRAIVAITDERQGGDRGNGELKDAAMRLRDYVHNPAEEAQALRGLLFAQYLGGNVAAALVNMTQPFQVTMPYLSQWAGVAGAAAQLRDALKVAWAQTTGDADLDRALKAAEERGVVAPQEVHQLMAQAAGTGTFKAGDDTATGDALAALNNGLVRLRHGWGKFFSTAELFNRRVTFVAAYRTAVAAGIANPAKFAEEAIHNTQFIYNKGNRPRWARGVVGSVVFTFKQYGISYIELLTRMARAGEPGSAERAAGQRAALFGLAMVLLLGGAGGLPFMEDVEDVVDAAMQRLGYNFSMQEKRRELLNEAFGRGLGHVLEKGVSGLPGVPIDVAGRLGLGNLIPGTGMLEKKTDRTRDVVEMIGPAGDLATRTLRAVDMLTAGEVVKAGLEVSPTAARNLAKAGDMAATGQYRDARGYKVLDVDAGDVVSKAIGFQPTAVARVQEADRETAAMVALVRMREQEIAAEWAKGIAEGKASEAAIRAREKMAAWNEKNPEAPIRIKIGDVLKRARNMMLERSQRIEKTAPKEIRQEVGRRLREE